MKLDGRRWFPRRKPGGAVWPLLLLAPLLYSLLPAVVRLQSTAPRRPVFTKSEAEIIEARRLLSGHQYQQAQSAYEKALQKFRTMKGLTSAAYAVALNELGIAHLMQGQLTEAQRYSSSRSNASPATRPTTISSWPMR